MSLKDDSKIVAPESEKTRKTREKLKKHFETVDQNITPQALQRQTLEIHRWISKHANERIVLRSKSFSLFDENQNAARLSLKIAQFIDRIKN